MKSESKKTILKKRNKKKYVSIKRSYIKRKAKILTKLKKHSKETVLKNITRDRCTCWGLRPPFIFFIHTKVL